MNIRFTLAAVAAVFAASTFVTDTAEAGSHKKRVAKAPAAKAAPAPAARACPLTAMLKAKRERMASHMKRDRVHHARPARAAKPVKVAKAAPAKAPKK